MMKVNLRLSKVEDTSYPNFKQKHFWISVSRQFLPVFLLAAFLPVGLMMVLSSQNFTWFSRAEKSLEINLWLEPQELVTYLGQPVTLRVMVEFSDEKKLIPSLSVQAEVEPQNPIVPQIVSYTKPFRGRLQIGTVAFTPQTSGTYQVKLPKDKVVINLPEAISVVTAPSNIHVNPSAPPL